MGVGVGVAEWRTVRVGVGAADCVGVAECVAACVVLAVTERVGAAFDTVGAGAVATGAAEVRIGDGDRSLTDFDGLLLHAASSTSRAKAAGIVRVEVRTSTNTS